MTRSALSWADIARFRGMLALAEGDPVEARRRFEEAVGLSAGAGLEHERARALTELGTLEMRESRVDAALALLDEARDIFRALGAARDVKHTEQLLQSAAANRPGAGP